ncbi:MAG TPA: putative lipopolysaccharide heptosyltransferase III [Chlamydiales bacterium]|jgi:heptosyltransferase-3|nr:putative lipopolysaccharide heptosyltransferase III [Chlamydiales bacterium]
MGYGDYPDLKGVQKILVVKMRQLGDVLLTGPVFTALKNRLPRAEIDAYIYSESLPMLEGHPAIASFLSYDRNWKKRSFFFRLYQELRLLWAIRRRHYDLVINLTEGDRGAIAAKYSGARFRVGFDPKGKGLFGKKKLYTHVVKNCPSLRHTVERNLDALRRIGIFPTLEERDLFHSIAPQISERMRERVGEGFLLIHPTSRWRFKCWPVEKMRALSKALLEEGVRLVFTAGPDPIEVQMIQEMTRDLPVCNLAGQITLKELSALIQLSSLLLCVDSLPLHLASALKKPVIALFGPTSEITWGPWRNPHAKIVSQNFSCRPCYQDGCGGSKVSDCLATLSVEIVLREVRTCLQSKVLSKVRSASFCI